MANIVHYDATAHRVHSVTVFQDHRADVNRRIKVQLKTGRNEVIVAYLPSGLDQDSIRVEGTDAATVFDVIYSPPSPAHSWQPDSVKQLTKKRATLAAERHLLLRQATLLEDYARALNSKDTNLSKLQDFLDFFIDKQRAINENSVALDDQIAAVDAEAKEERLSGYNCATKLTIVVLSEVDGEAELSLTYAVPGASWTPLYDLRVSIAEDGNSDNQVVLHYRASVTQCTGESWDGVHLTLSTASPHRGSTIPTLKPQTISELKVPPPSAPTSAYGMPYIASAPPVTGKPQTSTVALFGSAPTATMTGHGGLFGNGAASRETTGGLFGSSATAGAVSTGTATTGGLFGSTATTGTASPTAHNGVPSTVPAGGLFGTSTWFSQNAPPTGTQRGLFGPLPTRAATGGGLFGDVPTATGGLFGTPAAAPTATTGGLYGSAPTATGGLFTHSPAPRALTGGLYDSPTAPTGGLFTGVAPTGKTGGLFGTTATTGSLFGHGAPTATIGSAPLFGAGPATTATPASPPIIRAPVAESAVPATFAIEGLSTISSDTDRDSQTHKLSIANLKFSDVELERIAIPKEILSVFLQCKIKNTSEYPLLPGQASVYLNNSFVSKSYITVRYFLPAERKTIDPLRPIARVARGAVNLPHPALPTVIRASKASNAVGYQDFRPQEAKEAVRAGNAFCARWHVAPQESFSISLGVDDAVRVTYHPQSKHLVTAADSLLPSPSSRTSTTSFSQRISLRNNRLRAINKLVVRDQVPVSQDERIKVSVVEPKEKSAGSDGARWMLKNEDNAVEGDGIIGWVCSLPAGGNIDLELAWNVTAPVDVQWRSSES